jgi:signal transduction histidine kinase/CheY-like chemotaxis protein
MAVTVISFMVIIISGLLAVRQNILAASLIAMLLIILTVIYISCRMAKDLLKPILKLTNDVVLISKGNTDLILETKTGDELEVLSNTINEMIASIKKIKAEKERADEAAQKAIEEKNALGNLENVMNGLDALIYVTDPATGEILFVNDYMKQHFNLGENIIGQLCYKVFQKNHDKRCAGCPSLRLSKEPDKIIVWEEHNSLTNRIYRNVDRFIDWPNGKTVHLQHSADMTELIAAREYAEQSSKYKSAFLANMSHEIRTPMNAILGIAEIQLQDNNLPAEIELALQKIYESGDLLLNIINDILDLSKIEAGKLELSPVKYDIPSLIHDTAQLIRLRYESNPIEFIIKVDQNTPLDLLGDELRIKQVLNNVLSNAFKYTAEGEIEFSVFCEEKDQSQQNDDVTIVFGVRDTGQGMTQVQLDKLFDEYTRFNTDASRTTIGTGLGMSITKRLVDLMNGEITAQSEQNKGSVFTVRIPQKRTGSAVCGAELVEKLRDFKFHNTAMSKKAQFFREYMPYGSVLVVDDMDSNIYVTKGMLMPYGLNIETAVSGFEAIEKIKNGKVYDIIFMDHMMPKMDGIKAAEIIRNMGYKNCIIALTANALAGRAQMFMQNGFDGYISKPIDSRELNLALNDFIRSKKPPEVVEEARKIQREKNKKNIINEGGSVKQGSQKTGKISEKEKFFIHDAEKAINILENINGKLPDIDNEELELYITIVHGMKSALANIGEKKLSAAAYELEQAGEEKNVSLMLKNTSAFINMLQSIVDRLKPVNENTEMEISGEDRLFLQEKLKAIKTECSVFNKNKAKEALDDLKNKNWPKPETSLLDDIALHLLHSAFKKATAAVDSYLQT